MTINSIIRHYVHDTFYQRLVRRCHQFENHWRKHANQNQTRQTRKLWGGISRETFKCTGLVVLKYVNLLTYWTKKVSPTHTFCQWLNFFPSTPDPYPFPLKTDLCFPPPLTSSPRRLHYDSHTGGWLPRTCHSIAHTLTYMLRAIYLPKIYLYKLHILSSHIYFVYV